LNGSYSQHRRGHEHWRVEIRLAGNLRGRFRIVDDASETDGIEGVTGDFEKELSLWVFLRTRL
jgi:hypothetical protein